MERNIQIIRVFELPKFSLRSSLQRLSIYSYIESIARLGNAASKFTPQGVGLWGASISSPQTTSQPVPEIAGVVTRSHPWRRRYRRKNHSQRSGSSVLWPIHAVSWFGIVCSTTTSCLWYISCERRIYHVPIYHTTGR